MAKRHAITAAAAVAQRSGARLQEFLPEACSIPSFQETRPKRCPQGVKLDQTNNRISLPKLGWIRYRNSREVIGEVKTSRSSSHAANGTLASRRNTKCLNRFIRQRQWSVWTPESRNLPRFLMAPYTSQSTASKQASVSWLCFNGS